MTTTETGVTTAERRGTPLPCHWTVEPDGSRWLVPGCLTRIHNPDIDACDCPELAEQLAQAQQELAKTRRAHEGLREWCDSVVAAVFAHPDGKQILQNATRPT